MRLANWFTSLIRYFMTRYPASPTRFLVEWGGTRTGFSEVTGLSSEIEVVVFRDGNAPAHLVQKMPGMQKFNNIVLKRGIVRGDNEFYDWFNRIAQGRLEKRDVTIQLLNEEQEPVISWRVKNAWPCKIQGPDLKSEANEVAIETLELTHEGIEMVTPGN